MECEKLEGFIVELIESALARGLTYIGVCIGGRKFEVGDYLTADVEGQGTMAIKVGFDQYNNEFTNVQAGIKELVAQLAPGDKIMLAGGKEIYEGQVLWHVIIKHAQVLHVFSDEYIKKIIGIRVVTTPRPTITTEEIGAVNRLSSRIRAISERGSLTIECDQQLDIVDNHERAARCLVEERFLNSGNRLWIGGETKKGYTFVSVDEYALRELLSEFSL